MEHPILSQKVDDFLGSDKRHEKGKGQHPGHTRVLQPGGLHDRIGGGSSVQLSPSLFTPSLSMNSYSVGRLMPSSEATRVRFRL